MCYSEIMDQGPASPSCPEFKRYMNEFRARLRKALEENKWYLSEREGHDVGEQRATEDFLQNHFDRFAAEVRLAFCEHECSQHENCPLAIFIRTLPPTREALHRHVSKAKTEKPSSS